MRKKAKELNFTILYGVVLKKTKKYMKIDYGMGKIKVLLDEFSDTDDIKINYTVGVSGYLVKKGWFTCIEGQKITIFDKKPHYIKL